MSWNKCRESCQSMGASSYRWFHDGCCECVGDTCINYGVNESRCLDCHENNLNEPVSTGQSIDIDDDEEMDYGEELDNLQIA